MLSEIHVQKQQQQHHRGSQNNDDELAIHCKRLSLSSSSSEKHLITLDKVPATSPEPVAAGPLSSMSAIADSLPPMEAPTLTTSTTMQSSSLSSSSLSPPRPSSSPSKQQLVSHSPPFDGSLNDSSLCPATAAGQKQLHDGPTRTVTPTNSDTAEMVGVEPGSEPTSTGNGAFTKASQVQTTEEQERERSPPPPSSSSHAATALHASSTTTTSTATTVPRRTTKRRRHVTFTTVQIRRYPMLLGDNPSVPSGPPVSLGWEYDVLPEMPLVDFEMFRLRSRRLHSNHLILSHYKRLEIIERSGYTPQEIKAVEKELTKIRRQRNMSIVMTPLAPFQNIAESAGRKFRRGFGGKKT